MNEAEAPLTRRQFVGGGYRPKFGLVSVDRETQQGTPKPRARFLGDVARRNGL